MKNLTQCETGCITTILKNGAKGALKQRFLSFGMIKGASIKVIAFAPAKSSVEVKVGKMSIALRHEEAKLIEVAED